MKYTAKAPANIAFIKYWGKRDEKLRIPLNGSISMNLSGVFTLTSVEFDKSLKEDQVWIDKKLERKKEKERVVNHLDIIRKLAGIPTKASVNSENNFPKGTGIASSASGFAALTLGAASAVGLSLSEKKLSLLARLGSGSACRSIPDGFVEWKAGNSDGTSYARTLYPPDYWDIRDLIIVVGQKGKKVSSTEGHTLAESSPFFKSRISGMGSKIREIKKALKDKDFSKLGHIIEEEAINMHTVMMTSNPPLFYWLPETLETILSIQYWRSQGLEIYFTIDAGPNIHVICEGKSSEKVIKKLRSLRKIRNIIENKPSIGARIIN
ncbi:diphosphomevalonate decarboxylase [Candidatus Woesebacteria bacterium RIFCSPHIGHO2_01_FULL_38_9]|uniref:diphosphomevalonate decarboxylase n=1 Tax=Candidatus Woesebacteria bacterium RIFCSPHIGHO2_01_FULL_38_9 TaxID=1802492 RepID=A0A1F7Y168_9BACT|nr:MAG: diphosphomevalonate decarboxylase [Candidatus Woesebacteria bacterium RIFCSPHIGHO2_01_FULL_38_9]